MPPDPRISAQVNWTQYRPDRASGHYESCYQRADHPSRPLAFWIRYTLFSPRGHPEVAVGELWAVFFDGAPESFLEIATARTRLGPVSTPWLTRLVLRHRGVEHSLVALRQARRARGSYRYFRWDFANDPAQADRCAGGAAGRAPRAVRDPDRRS
jgi:hypothetical protein